MFKLLEMAFAARRMAAAEEAAKPWTCPECGTSVRTDVARRHLFTHKARLLSQDPLTVELRCWDLEKDLGPALAELKRRWPGRKFQLLPASFAEGSDGGGRRLRSVVAVEDDWTIPHNPI